MKEDNAMVKIVYHWKKMVDKREHLKKLKAKKKEMEKIALQRRRTRLYALEPKASSPNLNQDIPLERPQL